MTIFVGLGNHETKYHNTKHNVGYWVLAVSYTHLTLPTTPYV